MRLSVCLHRCLVPLLSVGFICMVQNSQPANCQTTTTSNLSTIPAKIISLPDLYWHFLAYQSYLDARADELDAKHQNGSFIRNDIQNRLHFTDSEFAVIRTSSQRFSAHLKELNKKAKLIRETRPADGTSQIKALIAQRQAYIDNEIYNINHDLSPEKKAGLDSFLKEFYAPKKISVRIPPTTLSTTSKGVQQ